MRKLLLFVLCLFAGSAYGQSPQQVILSMKKAPLTVQVWTIAVDCSWPVGQFVVQPAQLSGGTGNAITWALGSGAPPFLAINSSTGAVTVGTAITPAQCTSSYTINLVPTQQ